MSWEVLLPYAAWLGSTSFALWLGASTWRIAGCSRSTCSG